MGADGQVTMDKVVLKHGARKLRRLGDGQVLAGFAGATADAFTLFEKFEGKLKEYGKNLSRAAVELAKDWRTDRYLRRLEALLVVADAERTLILSGTGDVVEPDEGVAAIGSRRPRPARCSSTPRSRPGRSAKRRCAPRRASASTPTISSRSRSSDRWRSRGA